MNVYFQTFGCKVNVYETSAMMQMFQKAGYSVTEELSQADVVVLNSCTVTENADRKARAFARRVRQETPKAVFLLSGCFSQAFPDKAALLEPEILMGTSNRGEAVSLVDQYLQTKTPIRRVLDLKDLPFEPLEAEETVEHTRAFLKIQDGCEKYCAYCAIPKARGPVRSLSLTDIKNQCATLAKSGYKEIVLCGINLSAYGVDFGADLGDAVLSAAEVDDVLRIRLSSLEVDLMTEEILQKLLSCEKFCPQFHFSLQSGCSRTLHRMNRHYTAEEFQQVADRIRALFDRPTFTTDIIVGYPGETEEEFQESLRFCKEFGFLRAHVFPYSRRPGTMAAGLPSQITRTEKQRRSKEMIAATSETALSVMNSFVGQRARVLLEQKEGDYYTGYSDRYLPCRVYGEGLVHNQLVEGLVQRIEDGNAIIRL